MIKNGSPVTVEADSNTIDAALLYALPDEKIAQISEWIKKNVRAADRNCSGYSSYGLKNEFERDTGIYLTNNQFKHAMLLSGFAPNDPDALNWDFNIVLTRTIIENSNPLFNWLKQYEKEDSMIGDFARDTIADRDFPAMADYKSSAAILSIAMSVTVIYAVLRQHGNAGRNTRRTAKARRKPERNQ